MATISADGRTFLVDNKRLRILAGVAGYHGIPRAAWQQRLRKMRHAGLNTAVVPIPWAVHEPVPGRFNFDDSADIAEFITLAARERLYVIPRVGPFVNERTSLGAIPTWVLAQLDDDALPRTNHPSFTSLVSKWFARLTQVIAPLQATSAEDADDPRDAGKPIIAVQAEHHWFCGDHDTANQYFNLLTRYLREGSISVPTLTLNNMFAHAEGAIEAWSGYANLHTITRQLQSAWPDEPPIIGELDATTHPVFGEPTQTAKSPRAVERAIAEALAASGQPVIGAFAPAAPRSFAPGQLTHTPGAFLTPNPSRALVAEDASTGHAYHAAKRVLSFANAFARLFANAAPDNPPPVISPGASAPAVTNERTGERDTATPPVSITSDTVRGSAGTAVFLFADDTKKTKHPPVPITLPNGLQVTADIGNLAVSWVLLDTHLVADKTLDYATLPAVARTRSALVLFGARGTSGAISINGTPTTVTVPTTKKPAIHTLEGITVAVCTTDQADALIVDNDTIHIGATDVSEPDADGKTTPIPAPGFKSVTTIHPDGSVTSSNPTPPKQTKPKLTLANFAAATTTPFTDGSSDRYARVEGPAPAESLGTPDAYAWYRATFKHKSQRKPTIAAFHAADRIHLFLDNAKPKVLGDGPDKPGRITTLNLKAKEHTLVALADNMGRPVTGFDMTTPKGLWGHLYEVAPVKAKPTVNAVGPAELLDQRSPIEGAHRGDTTHPDRLTWTFTHRKKTPIFLRMDHADWTGIVFLNDEPVAAFTPGSPVSLSFDHETLNRGKNTIELAVAGDDAEAEDAYTQLQSFTSLFEGVTNITENAEWAFANLTEPDDDAFSPFSKAALAGPKAKALKGHPTWWRCTFPPAPDQNAPHATLRLVTTGLSKGHVFVNGHPVARYWSNTHNNKPLTHDTDIWIPADTLHTDQDNTITIFDEHGFSPAKVALKAGPLAEA